VLDFRIGTLAYGPTGGMDGKFQYAPWEITLFRHAARLLSDFTTRFRSSPTPKRPLEARPAILRPHPPESPTGSGVKALGACSGSPTQAPHCRRPDHHLASCRE